MSTRESFLISPIKSIQRGSVTATNNGTGTVTVTAVDTAKSVLTINAVNGIAVGFSSVVSFATSPKMVLTNSTTLTWTGGNSTGYTTTVNTAPSIAWQLVEYK
jgi:hypothetical protein